MGDPYAVVKESKPFWCLQERPMFHHLVSMVTSQEIAFAKGRAIRIQLYKMAEAATGHGILTQQFIASLDVETLKKMGLAEHRCELVKYLATIPSKSHADDLNAYAVVRGVGSWTIKGLQIIFNLGPNVILYEDKWIRKRLGEMIGQGEVTEKRAAELFKTWPGQESLMSYFLWRIQPSGIQKLLQNEPLLRADFV
ncbi:DNA-3-methyladenine glycosylase [uncultured virus]|nr:DNA-3-methyladenine glycosylase [uncultured virus]